MNTLFRIFVLKEIHGWNHETALVEYLDSHPELCKQFGFEAVPNQSTVLDLASGRFARPSRANW